MELDEIDSNQTSDLGFNILGYIVDAMDTAEADKADPLESLALALVAWVAGPDTPLTTKELAMIISTVSEQACIWNEIHGDDGSIGH